MHRTYRALWDIKGRQAGLPVYQVLGGKCREAADCYAHAAGAEIPEVIDNVKKYLQQGFRNVRVQVGVPGMAGYGSGGAGTVKSSPALHNDPVFEPGAYIRRALKLFEECRLQLGDEVGLLHDVHERVTPNPGRSVCQRLGKVQIVFHGGPALSRGHRLFPADSSELRDTDRHGRALLTTRTNGSR